MTEEQVLLIKEACTFCEIECRIIQGYSGRRMFGERTLGVVVNSELEVLGAVVAYLKQMTLKELREAPQLDDLQQDDMGKDDVVLY